MPSAIIWKTNYRNPDGRANALVERTFYKKVNEQDKNEYCLKAFEIKNGVESDLVGHVAKEFLPFKRCYENKLAQIIKLYSKFTNSYENNPNLGHSNCCFFLIRFTGLSFINN